MRLWTVKLCIQNTSVWANGGSPPAWGEKVTCWWAIAQIFTGQIQDCRLFHYLPVSPPIIWSVFFCLFLSPPRRRSRFLARSVKSWAESARDEKQTKCLLIQRPRVTALSNGITPKSQTKTTSAAGYQSQISRPLMYNINAQAKKVWTSRLNGKAAEQTRHPRSSAFFILFSLLFFFSFVMFSTAGGTKTSKFSQQHLCSAERSDQVTMTCTQCCTVGSYTVSCLTYSLVRREWDYPAVMCAKRRK